MVETRDHAAEMEPEARVARGGASLELHDRERLEQEVEILRERDRVIHAGEPTHPCLFGVDGHADGNLRRRHGHAVVKDGPEGVLEERRVREQVRVSFHM